MSERSVATGSAAPGAVPNGIIRLYSMRFCPFSHRTRLVLSAKGINHETININLKNKPEWFVEKNPFGQTPTLETPAGEVIYESPITCDYLDEVYPENKLLPSSPYGRAQQKMMLEHFSKIIPCFYKIPKMRASQEDASKVEAELKEKFSKLNECLLKKKKKFFVGDSITMIDYMMWPWFERLESFGLKSFLQDTPELKRWTECMLEDPAVKATMHSVDDHKGYYISYVQGKPDYDYGL